MVLATADTGAEEREVTRPVLIRPGSSASKGGQAHQRQHHAPRPPRAASSTTMVPLSRTAANASGMREPQGAPVPVKGEAGLDRPASVGDKARRGGRSVGLGPLERDAAVPLARSRASRARRHSP